MSMVWKPIETAPKDTQVLIYQAGWITQAVWNINAERWDGVDDDLGEGYPETRVPTHWMPLPAPPASQEGK